MNRTKRVKYDPSALALSRKDLSVALICFDVRPKVLCFKPLLFFLHSFFFYFALFFVSNFEAFEEKNAYQKCTELSLLICKSDIRFQSSNSLHFFAQSLKL